MAPYRWIIGDAVRTSRVLVSLLVCPVCGFIACRRSDVPPQLNEDVTPPMRDVRVLIASNVKRVRLRAEEEISVVDDNGLSRGTYGLHEWIVVSPAPKGGIRFGGSSWSVATVTARTFSTGLITLAVEHGSEWSPGNRYPGRLCVIVDDDGQLDVINTVDVERYVASVVANEVWPTFETEAYRVQAIAARTFVLYQMIRRQRAAFDVAATQGSQVYRGIRTDDSGRRAAEAARYTQGIVCTWRDKGVDRLFCTYYSAACGGRSQSAAIFGPENDIEPLSGGVFCDYCKIAPGGTYRWGPVRLSLQDVRSSLVSRYPEFFSLGPIGKIEVIRRTAGGGPMTLRLHGASGQSHDILAEPFRLAVGPDLIRSTFFSLRMEGRAVVLERGRGFGHGLGLCQWGMEGQARRGKRAGELLRYYYPGCKLTRVY